MFDGVQHVQLQDTPIILKGNINCNFETVTLPVTLKLEHLNCNVNFNVETITLTVKLKL